MDLNIHSRGDWPANMLSNFPETPFVLDGIECASGEGFIQALKFPEIDLQHKICRLVGRFAKAYGRQAVTRIEHEQTIWWQGKAYGFRSPEHFALIERGLRAKFTQCHGAKQAIIATQGMTLKHNLGYESPNTSLPESHFIDILNRIRADLLEA